MFAAVLCGLLLGLDPGAARAGDAGKLGLSVPSCVPGSPLIAFDVPDRRVLLEPADRDRVHRAMAERYPASQLDGTAPLHMLLWKPRGRDWLYVSLANQKGDRDALCFMAVFTAGGAGLTRTLIEKYFRPI